MVDELDESRSEGLDLPKYLGIVRRRHLHFLVSMFIGWAGVWVVSWVLPPLYQSGTLILVEQPTMPKDYVTPNVTDDLQARMQSITQQILSRTRLLHIIEQYHLYSLPHADRSADDKVERMRNDTDVEVVRDARSDQITAFNVYYTSRDPRLAQQVTAELTNLFINENLEVRQQHSEDTTNFLETRLDDARKTLASQEEKIRVFKAQYLGEMPGQLASNLEILNGLQSQLHSEEDALNAAKQQHVYLQTLVDEYRSLETPSASADGGTVGLLALDHDLDKFRAQLADLSSRYTDRHPDVRKLKEQVAETEKQRDQLIASLKTNSITTTPDQSNDPPADADPTQASMLLQVQSQLRSNQLEIKNREHSVAALKIKIEGYQARLNEEPIREQQLADLARGYDQSKANYDDLLKKKNESAMATSMELLQQGERFRIIDPPSFPQKPTFPNRLKFCGIGLALGIVLGTLVAGASEMLDARIHDEKELKKLLPPAIISEIPTIMNLSDREAQTRRVWIGCATASAVFATILIGTAFTYLRG
jgi:polysaccharide biosynthesis transport protein